MRDYEAVYIFDSSLEEETINEKLARFHDLLTGEEGAEVTTVDHWGKRTLAYSIQNKDSGYYVVSHFTTSAEALPEYERILKLDDDLLRHLVVVNEGELSASQFSPPEEGADDDDDDDDDDKE